MNFYFDSNNQLLEINHNHDIVINDEVFKGTIPYAEKSTRYIRIDTKG